MQPEQNPFKKPIDSVQPPAPTVPPIPSQPTQPAQSQAPQPVPTPVQAPIVNQPPRPTVSVSPAGKELPKSEGIKSIVSTILILLIAPILALGITAFLFQSYEVDGPSMETSLQTHDRLIIWKAPKTISRITDKDYIPKRGDVIVFVKKGLYDFNADKEKQLIKRVVALPGEHVVVKDNLVTVYNKEHPEGFNPDKTQPYGKVIGETPGSVDITVPAGEIFVMGDNRLNSLDSRIFGSISNRDIVGKLVARILPLKNAERF